MKKQFLKMVAFILPITIAALLFPLNVSANAPGPANSLSIELTNIPETVVFADLLIIIDKGDKNYTSVNENNLISNDLTSNSEIVLYSENGFESFTFHYKGASSTIKIYKIYDDKYSYVDFCKGLEYREYFTQYEDLLSNYRNVKIAFLDSRGNIISVSEKFKLPKESRWTIFAGYIQYDFDSGKIDLRTHINAYFIIFGVIYLVFFTIFSVGIETLIAVIFRFRRKEVGLVAAVNILTQGLMRLLYLLLPLSYFAATIILEALVYISEYIIFRKKMPEVKPSKILYFTIVANTVSLVSGLIFLSSRIGSLFI